MPIFDQNGREVIRILDSQGREIETVYDQNGVIVYTNAVTIIGTSPMQFKALGLPLKDYRIYGETLQDGTPSPDMPVDVVGCGVRTENLFDETYPNIRLDMPEYRSIFVGDGEFTLSTSTDRHNNATNLFFLAGRVTSGAATSTNGVWKGSPRTITSLNGYVTITYRYYHDEKSDPRFNTAMLNLGSATLPYEPYGYKLPVTTTNGTDTVTTPIYVGSEPLHRIGEHADYVDYSSSKIMRRIKKLVLTGGSADGNTNINAQGIIYITPLSTLKNANAAYCTHFKYVDQWQGSSMPSNSFTTSGGAGASLWFKTDYTTVADFKSYLAAQYAAGTPVTVWYVLLEPIEEEAPVPFPELPTLSGTNTLTVDTTVKPSEIDLTGRLKTSG